MRTSPTRWHPCVDRDALDRAALEAIRGAARDAIAARGVFHLVLAGGATPQGAYRKLCASATDFTAWQFYFGDERCLPPQDAERNSQMARDAGFAAPRVSNAQFHVIAAELGPGEAARRYAELLAGVPEFDLVLLGLGEDGHTASLFPGHPWGDDAASADVLAVSDAPKPPPLRVSLSSARLSRARAVYFMVDGEGKRAAVSAWRAKAFIPARSIAPPGGVDVLVSAALLQAQR
jgi:6-phosphogluconolactonase